MSVVWYWVKIADELSADLRTFAIELRNGGALQ